MPVTTVDEYILKHPKWENQLRQLRDILLSTELEETIKWGAPTYTVNGKNVIGIAAFKNHYALWFHNGALLKENTSLLQASEGTKAMRQIRFEDGDEIRASVLQKYVLEAVQNQKEGKEIKPERNHSAPEIPSELTEEFKKDKDLKRAFQELSLGKQREYCNFIAEAKQEKTRHNRLEKSAALIKEGKGLYDKYKNC